DVFIQATEQMVQAAAKTIVAKLMRDLSEDDAPTQLSLPGLGLPSAIAVQTAEGTYYVRSDKATWDELLAGRQIREANVSAAQAKLAAYDESCDLLRPYMEGTGRTV